MALKRIDQVVLKFQRTRLSFPELFEPKAMKNDPNSKPRFGVTFILDPKYPPHQKAIAEIEAEIKRVTRETWGDKPPAKLKQEFFGKGEDMTNSQTGDVYAGYEGMMFIRANSQAHQPPRVTGKDRDELPKGDSRIYPGVYAHGSVNIYANDTNGPRLCCGLRAVQSLEYGDALGGRVIGDNEFADFDDGDDGL